MTPGDAELVRHRLRKATETLNEAEGLFELGYTTGVVNRAYYACFYAVTALLLTEGLSSARHGGVIALFNQHWIKTSRLPSEMGAFYNQLFERRQAGDYRDSVSFDREAVRKWLDEAHLFIGEVSRWLRTNTEIDCADA